MDRSWWTRLDRLRNHPVVVHLALLARWARNEIRRETCPEDDAFALCVVLTVLMTLWILGEIQIGL